MTRGQRFMEFCYLLRDYQDELLLAGVQNSPEHAAKANALQFKLMDFVGQILSETPESEAEGVEP